MNFFKGKNPVFIIAEIGGNHEGDYEYAKYLTHLAAESGVDAIKFQIYSGDTLVNRNYDPERNNHFKKFQLKKEQYRELAVLCKNLGVSFMASIWDYESISDFNEYSPIFKVGSGDLTAYNFILKLLNTQKPIILSTGLATEEEVIKTINFIKNKSPNYITEKKLAILQCTSMYPIPDHDANLSVIKSYKKLFDLPIGYSDHTQGTDAIEFATIMGAEIIEVHFTDTRDNKTFRDHKVSLTKDEIKYFINRLKYIQSLLGNERKNQQIQKLQITIYIHSGGEFTL